MMKVVSKKKSVWAFKDKIRYKKDKRICFENEERVQALVSAYSSMTLNFVIIFETS